jgi:metal-responsive CopG/Arc/MetJ family transcriptional regulator
MTAAETMKTAISLPDSVFEEAEALANQLGLSRSELYTKALQAYVRRHNRDRILSKLNQVYSEESSELDPVLAKMQFMSLPNEELVFLNREGAKDTKEEVSLFTE